MVRHPVDFIKFKQIMLPAMAWVNQSNKQNTKVLKQCLHLRVFLLFHKQKSSVCFMGPFSEFDG
jgi:hypothetical protein